MDSAFRGCWSFPLETVAAKVIGTLAMYHPQPRAASARDLELATLLTHAAALVISRHQETERRAQAEAPLRLRGHDVLTGQERKSTSTRKAT
jgi:GAF domain-containing protein